jgi:hypothetical protein
MLSAPTDPAGKFRTGCASKKGLALLFLERFAKKYVCFMKLLPGSQNFFRAYHATVRCAIFFFHTFAPSRKLLHSTPIDAHRIRTHNARNLRTASQPKFFAEGVQRR